MGNSIAFRHSKSQRQTPKCKVILWDGSVHEFDPPLTAAELMLDHPQQAVVEFHSAVAGKRPAPLPADATLEAKKVYLMLPLKRGTGKAAPLSGEELRRVMLTANAALKTRASLLSSSASFLPVFARGCVAAAGGEKEKKREIANETTAAAANGEEKKTTSFVELESDGGVAFLSRQISGKRGNWKPSLDTIEEKVKSELDQNKIRHWLF